MIFIRAKKERVRVVYSMHISAQPSRTRIRIVLFDLGYTLLYFDGDWSSVFLQAQERVWQSLSRAGLPLEKAIFLRRLQGALAAYYAEREVAFVEYTTAHVLRTLLAEEGFRDIPEATLQAALTAMYATTQVHWLPDPHAHATLAQLRSDGYHLGIISNAAHDDDVQTLVERHNLRSYFDLVLTSAAAGIRKPNPRIFQLALSHWEAAPQDAIMVGDTLGADILGAHNAGMQAVWITRYTKVSAADLAKDFQPDYQIASLEALPLLLASLP